MRNNYGYKDEGRNITGFAYEELYNEDNMPTRQLESQELGVKVKKLCLNPKVTKRIKKNKKVIGAACVLLAIGGLIAKFTLFNNSINNIQSNVPKQGVVITGSSSDSMDANDI